MLVPRALPAFPILQLLGAAEPKEGWWEWKAWLAPLKYWQELSAWALLAFPPSR